MREDLAQTADEVRETHISWVFLEGPFANKVKKPVNLGFLDFSTLEARRAACEAEVRLNARLAPDVYRGISPVVIDPQGVHRIGQRGRIVDWAVQMRRLRDEDRADVRLACGELTIAEVDRIAERVARFHESARVDSHIARFGTPEAIALNVRENFRQTRAAIGAFIERAQAREIEHWQLRFLDRNAELLRERIDAGRVRDGHGDLRLEHVYFENDSIVVIDCIEFNDRFRYADVCADIAFLAMDLGWHGRVDLAERLLATYAMETNDFTLYRLVDFYESYRAFVRGKVSVMLAADESAPAKERERARSEARRYFLLALAAERRPLLGPMVIAIGGIIASGKSTIADRLGAAMGAPVVNSDRVRKHLLGARPTDRLYDGAFASAYDPELTKHVYATVRDYARAVVGSGRPVILDASFRSPAMRADAQKLARSLDVPFVFVECRADPDVCRRRLRKRALAPSVSDGRIEIFDEFLAAWEPVRELPANEHIVVDSSRSVEETMRALAGRLPMWPAGLTQ